MTNFKKFERSYTSSIQLALLFGIGYEDAKKGNEVLNHLCKSCIERGYYSKQDKEAMKFELDVIKEVLDAEINCTFGI